MVDILAGIACIMIVGAMLGICVVMIVGFIIIVVAGITAFRD